MREIKFRAWDGTAIKAVDGRDNYTFDENGYLVHIGEFDSPTPQVMQYTGLKDKNGVEIYEGDIVEKSYPRSKPQRRSMVFEIEYHELFDNEMGFCVGMGFDFHGEDSHELEVIGNIYENKELLK